MSNVEVDYPSPSPRDDVVPTALHENAFTNCSQEAAHQPLAESSILTSE